MMYLSQLAAKSQALRAGPGTSPGQATSPLEGVTEDPAQLESRKAEMAKG